MKSSDGKEDNYAQCVRVSIRLGGCTASNQYMWVLFVPHFSATIIVVAGILITNWCWAYLRIG